MVGTRDVVWTNPRRRRPENFGERLLFRGGTALHKIVLRPAARCSQDLDFVQLREVSSGSILGMLRARLNPWLGEPQSGIGPRGATLTHFFESEGSLRASLNRSPRWMPSGLMWADAGLQKIRHTDILPRLAAALALSTPAPAPKPSVSGSSLTSDSSLHACAP
jgi:hypothetical protein